MSWQTQINNSSAELMEAYQAMCMAELAYDEAKKKYEAINKQLAESMLMNGLNSCSLEDGTKITVKVKATCNIVKDAEKARGIAFWLTERGFGDKVKISATVPETEIDKLEAAGIIHQKNMEMNTNSVKAIVGQMVGAGTITIGDLPAGLNYFEQNVVEVRRG